MWPRSGIPVRPTTGRRVPSRNSTRSGMWSTIQRLRQRPGMWPRSGIPVRPTTGRRLPSRTSTRTSPESRLSQSVRSEFLSRLGTPIRSGVRPAWVRGIPRNSSGTPLRRPVPRNEMSRFSQRRRQTPGMWPRDEILAPRRTRQPANIQQDYAPSQPQRSRPVQSSRLRISRQSRSDRFPGRARNVTRPERRFPTGRSFLTSPTNPIRQRQQLRGRQPVVGRAVRPSDLQLISRDSRQNSFGGNNLNRFSQRINSRRQFGGAPTQQQRARDRLNAKVMKSSSPATLLSSSTSSTTTPQKTWPIWAVALVVVSAIVILLMSVLIVMLFKWMHKLRHPIHG